MVRPATPRREEYMISRSSRGGSRKGKISDGFKDVGGTAVSRVGNGGRSCVGWRTAASCVGNADIGSMSRATVAGE